MFLNGQIELGDKAAQTDAVYKAISASINNGKVSIESGKSAASTIEKQSVLTGLGDQPLAKTAQSGFAERSIQKSITRVKELKRLMQEADTYIQQNRGAHTLESTNQRKGSRMAIEAEVVVKEQKPPENKAEVKPAYEYDPHYADEDPRDPESKSVSKNSVNNDQKETNSVDLNAEQTIKRTSNKSMSVSVENDRKMPEVQYIRGLSTVFERPISVPGENIKEEAGSGVYKIPVDRLSKPVNSDLLATDFEERNDFRNKSQQKVSVSNQNTVRSQSGSRFMNPVVREPNQSSSMNAKVESGQFEHQIITEIREETPVNNRPTESQAKVPKITFEDRAINYRQSEQVTRQEVEKRARNNTAFTLPHKDKPEALATEEQPGTQKTASLTENTGSLKEVGAAESQNNYRFSFQQETPEIRPISKTAVSAVPNIQELANQKKRLSERMPEKSTASISSNLPFTKVAAVEIGNNKFETQKYKAQMQIAETFIHTNQLSEKVEHILLVPGDSEFILTFRQTENQPNDVQIFQKYKATALSNLSENEVVELKRKASANQRISRLSVDNQAIRSDPDTSSDVVSIVAIRNDYFQDGLQEFKVEPVQTQLTQLEIYIAESKIIRRLAAERTTEHWP